MTKETFAVIIAVAAGAYLLFAVADYAAGRDCKNRWQDSGLGFRYGTLGGCQVEHVPGRWIPAENYIVKGN